jgi:hypothetical protein
MNRNQRDQLQDCLDHNAEDLEITTDDMDIYINGTTGNDTTGKGTAALPYATPMRAAFDIPRRISHQVNVYIAALPAGAAYPANSLPRLLDCMYVGNGSLNIFGVGAPIRKAVHGGPHIVTAIATPSDNVQRITIGAAAGWVAEEFVGCWVRVVTGAHVNRAWKVFGNGTDTICIPMDITGDAVHVNDTVELIYPATKITVNHDLDILYDAHVSTPGTGFSPESHLTLANLWLDASGSTSYTQFRVRGNAGQTEGPVLDFVRVDGLAYGMEMVDATTGTNTPLDNSYVAACGAGIANMGEGMNDAGLSLVSAGLRADALLILYGNCNVCGVAVSGKVTTPRFGSAMFSGGAAAIVGAGGSGEIFAWLSGIDAVTPAVQLNGGVWNAVMVNVEGACNYAVDTDYGAIVRLHGECTCDAVLCDKSALSMGGLCKVSLDHAMAGFLGKTVGQEAWISKMDITKKSATWPAAAGYDGDLKGGELLRTA